MIPTRSCHKANPITRLGPLSWCFLAGFLALSHLSPAQSDNGNGPHTADSTDTLVTTGSATVERIPFSAMDTEQALEAAQSRRVAFADALKSVEQTLETLDEETSTPLVVSVLEAQIDLLLALDGLAAQQVTAIEQTQTLRQQERQVAQELEHLLEAPEEADATPVSIVDLDRLREELTLEQGRQENLETRLRIARGNLEQAQRVLETPVSATRLENDVASDEQRRERADAVAQRLGLSHTTDALEEMLRQEQIFYREIELENVVIEQNIHTLRLDLLGKRVALAEQRVTFLPRDLEDQKQRLLKERGELTRQLNRLNDQRDIIKRRWSDASDRVTPTLASDDPIRLEAEARRIEMDLTNIRIEALNKRIELIGQREQTWIRRHAMFNRLYEDPATPQQWKSEAALMINALDDELILINARFEPRQSERSSARTVLDQLAADAQAARQWLEQQEKHLTDIITALDDQRNALQRTRLLQSKLVDEINALTAMMTWKERFEALLVMELRGNPVRSWLYAFSSAFVIFLFLYLCRRAVAWRLRRKTRATQSDLMQYGIDGVNRLKIPFLFVLALYFGSLVLTFTEDERKSINTFFKIILTIQIGWILSYVIRLWILSYLMHKSKRDASSMSALSIFNFISQLIIWSIIVILTVQALGHNVSALVTGLGIGGVAVALALQSILSDLFASLSIVLDKPFVTGDFIIFDNATFVGSVEHIGIKTTRIRSISGEQIVCSNNDLLNTRIRNFKRMRERRVVFKIGVTYQTTPANLTAIPHIIRHTIESLDQTRFDRAHFASFGDFALVFEAVYFVLDPDYTLYMNIQQEINMALLQSFAERDIAFAYPTQTIHLESNVPPSGASQ